MLFYLSVYLQWKVRTVITKLLSVSFSLFHPWPLLPSNMNMQFDCAVAVQLLCPDQDNSNLVSWICFPLSTSQSIQPLFSCTFESVWYWHLDNGACDISSQVHEMAMVSAIQEAQRDNLRSFNDYMMKVLQVMTYFNPIQIFGFVLTKKKNWVCFFIFWTYTFTRLRHTFVGISWSCNLASKFSLWSVHFGPSIINLTYFIRIFLCLLGFLTLIVSWFPCLLYFEL